MFSNFLRPATYAHTRACMSGAESGAKGVEWLVLEHSGEWMWQERVKQKQSVELADAV